METQEEAKDADVKNPPKVCRLYVAGAALFLLDINKVIE